MGREGTVLGGIGGVVGSAIIGAVVLLTMGSGTGELLRAGRCQAGRRAPLLPDAATCAIPCSGKEQIETWPLTNL